MIINRFKKRYYEYKANYIDHSVFNGVYRLRK